LIAEVVPLAIPDENVARLGWIAPQGIRRRCWCISRKVGSIGIGTITVRIASVRAVGIARGVRIVGIIRISIPSVAAIVPSRPISPRSEAKAEPEPVTATIAVPVAAAAEAAPEASETSTVATATEAASEPTATSAAKASTTTAMEPAATEPPAATSTVTSTAALGHSAGSGSKD